MRAVVDSLRLFLLTLFFPLLVIGMLWRRPRRPLGAWLATLFLALGVTGFTLLASPWGWFGLPMRYALLAALVLAMVFSLRRAVPEESKPESPLRTIVKVLLGFYFGGVALGALRGHEVPPSPMELAFPLRGGVYLVAHGGSTGPSNMYNPDAAQRYAVDFVKLNGAGMRARGLYPKELERYAIFGAEVLSPCSGGVLAVVDGLPDQTPGTFDDKHPAGNQVVIRCGDVAVTLAHLQKGSVAARVGTRVTASQLLGRAGNSGRSSEPHLHVHAERGGKAVPARFGGKWLVRNDVVRLPPQSSILNPQSSIRSLIPHPSHFQATMPP
jgi:hypothetical protein